MKLSAKNTSKNRLHSFSRTLNSLRVRNTIAKSKVKNQLRHLASVFKVGVDNVTSVSSTEKRGKEEILQKFEQILTATAYTDEEP